MSNKVLQRIGSYSRLPSHFLLTPGEIASFTRFQVDTVRRWLRLRKLRGFRIQGEWRILREDFVAFWEAHLRQLLEWDEGQANWLDTMEDAAFQAG